MMKLVSVEEMRAIEQEADSIGITYEKMMEFAGRGLAEVIADEYAGQKTGGVLGLVGSGNNGGDTLVALAYLADEGWPAAAYIVKEREPGDPLIVRLENSGGKTYRIQDDPEYQQLSVLIEENALLLDGVLGTGIRLPLRGELAKVLDFVRQKVEGSPEPPHVIAVDCPSGVDTDSGETAPETISAELTVTMAAVKRGLLEFPAAERMGDLKVVSIGLPDEGEGIEAWRKVKRMVPTMDWVRDILPPRPANSHKGTFGTALVVAGSENFTGAALLAGESAYRIGAGLVTVAVPRPLHAALAGQLTEATWVLLPEEDGFIAQAAAQTLKDQLERPTAMLFGCGFGMQDTTKRFIADLIGAGDGDQIELPPLVIDADGLKLLSQIKNWFDYLPKPAVLTPHPGEMALMTGLSIGDIQSDRTGTAEEYSRKWGHVLVLKGAFTVIASPDGRTAVIPVASPVLARAGTGDVLSGIIAGLRAQGMDAFEAATAGAWIHAQAGLVAGTIMGNAASVLAGDVMLATVDVLSELT